MRGEGARVGVPLAPPEVDYYEDSH
jgi:hypothetical protein